MVQAKPELVDARAENPRPWSIRALPMSHGFGSTKVPWVWSSRNARRFCSVVCVEVMASARLARLADELERSPRTRGGMARPRLALRDPALEIVRQPSVPRAQR